jgi:hypothetical protein
LRVFKKQLQFTMATKGKFEPKTPVVLNPPKDDPITPESLSKCNGKSSTILPTILMKLQLTSFRNRQQFVLRRHQGTLPSSSPLQSNLPPFPNHYPMSSGRPPTMLSTADKFPETGQSIRCNWKQVLRERRLLPR